MVTEVENALQRRDEFLIVRVPRDHVQFLLQRIVHVIKLETTADLFLLQLFIQLLVWVIFKF